MITKKSMILKTYQVIRRMSSVQTRAASQQIERFHLETLRPVLSANSGLGCTVLSGEQPRYEAPQLNAKTLFVTSSSNQLQADTLGRGSQVLHYHRPKISADTLGRRTLWDSGHNGTLLSSHNVRGHFGTVGHFGAQQTVL